MSFFSQDFWMMVFACFIGSLATGVVFLIRETKSNVSFIQRFKWRNNCLAILHQEVIKLKLQGEQDNLIRENLHEKYKNAALPFMVYGSTSSVDLDAYNFIGKILEDPRLFEDFAVNNKLSRKDIKQLNKELQLDKEKRDAKLTLSNILVDASAANIDKAMKWLPLLMTDYVKNPNEEDDSIPSPSYYSAVVWYYLTKSGVYLKNVSFDIFAKCLSVLQKVNPGMNFKSNRRNTTRYTNNCHVGDAYDFAIRKRISEIIKS